MMNQAARKIRASAPLPLNGGRALVKSYAAGTWLERHDHPYVAIVLVLEGAFEETVGGRTARRLPGALRIMPAAEPHENRYGPRGACSFLVETALAQCTDLLPAMPFDEIALCPSATPPASIAQEMYREYVIRDDVSALALEGYLLELAAALVRWNTSRCRQPPAWLGKTIEKIDAEFSRPTSIGELAREAGIHPTHLARVFRQHVGLSPLGYVSRARIQWAKGRLALSDDSIARIALQAGYADQASFTRRFRALTRMTPAVFRSSTRSPSSIVSRDTPRSLAEEGEMK